MKWIVIMILLCILILSVFCFWRYREFYQMSNIENRYYFIDCWKFDIKIPYLKPHINEFDTEDVDGNKLGKQKSIPLDNNREVIGIKL